MGGLSPQAPAGDAPDFPADAPIEWMAEPAVDPFLHGPRLKRACVCPGDGHLLSASDNI